MLFLECQSKGIGSHSRPLTYEIPGERVGPEHKQRNVPVWAIHGQYSLGLPTLASGASSPCSSGRRRDGCVSSRRAATGVRSGAWLGFLFIFRESRVCRFRDRTTKRVYITAAGIIVRAKLCDSPIAPSVRSLEIPIFSVGSVSAPVALDLPEMTAVDYRTDIFHCGLSKGASLLSGFIPDHFFPIWRFPENYGDDPNGA